MVADTNTTPVLQVEKLTTRFFSAQGIVTAVDRVDLTLNKGETVALVGESGCGKSATALSIMGLIPQSIGQIAGGRVLFMGDDFLKMNGRAQRRIRGNRIAMIFQEPMKALNPVIRVGEQIAEVCRLHLKKNRAQARDMAVQMLESVKLPDPEQRVLEYPHQLSGGMQQRVMIAMALVCRPDLVLADEPTTALDVTVQAQILDLLKGFQGKERMAMLLITHDLALVQEMADRACVMYASQIVEQAASKQLLAAPKHPYTAGLIRSIPRMAPAAGKLDEIPGQVPNLLTVPAGCRFHPRCFKCQDRCRTELPLFREIEAGRWLACHYPLD